MLEVSKRVSPEKFWTNDDSPLSAGSGFIRGGAYLTMRQAD